MRKLNSQEIVLGPGGLIRDVGANEELLEKIRKTPPLPPTDLLKLATFFRGYPTNAPLGDHLELIALRYLINEPGAQEALTRAGYAVHPMGVPNPADFWEDAPPPIGDGGIGEGNRGEPPPTIFMKIQRVSYSGVGLLIETPFLEDDDQRQSHYIIGVAPDPASLPDSDE
ncbi:MAG TPA: hypothetical protein VFA10_29770 [Ktedonobacteraceae bacterium]|jgi:hypothetical protein|nr:hypothetical protein [Ktedonobacteraceae bacterium]